MRLIGLTGGIASGKSAVGARLRERGIDVIDADQIGHELIDPGGAAVAAVAAAFPAAVDGNGRLSRESLGEIVFSSPAARAQLNELLHPLIAGEVQRRCGALEDAGAEAVVVEAALLAENGVRDPWLDGLILVTAPEDVRVERLLRDRGMGPEAALARLRAQSDPGGKVAIADWVIENNAGFDLLMEQVDAVAGVIHAEAGRP